MILLPETMCNQCIPCHILDAITGCPTIWGAPYFSLRADLTLEEDGHRKESKETGFKLKFN